MNILFIYSLGLITCIGLWFFNMHIINDKLIEQIRKYPYTKYEKCNPLLGTGNGIGFVLLNSTGRYDYNSNSTAWYLFFSIIIPIIPIGCYRASEVGRKGNSTQYKIYGHEKWKFWEVVSIYLGTYTWIAGIIFIIAIICEFF